MVQKAHFMMQINVCVCVCCDLLDRGGGWCRRKLGKGNTLNQLYNPLHQQIRNLHMQ